MTGSLQVKNKKYYVVLHWYDVNGKRKQKWIKTGLSSEGNNKREAKKLLQKIVNEYEDENLEMAPSSDILFSDYVLVWLKHAKNRVELTTYQSYESLARLRVIPYFQEKQIKLTDINRKNLQTFFDSIIKNGRMDGKGALSPTTIKRIKNIVSQTLVDAQKHDLITNNPCSLLELPRLERYQSSFYNAEQLRTLLRAAEGDVLEYLIKITAQYGLRRSEVLGIKWESVDFTNRTLTIKHTVVKVVTTIEKDRTKNNASYRSFMLDDNAMAIFRKLKAEEENNRRLFGSSYEDNDYVFKWADGKPFSPDYVTRHFSRFLKKKGLPHIRFHELRHSCASLLLNEGFSLKDVQSYMGHADISMTADIYGHLDIKRKNELVQGVSECLF